ncbi:MAG: hypothetical protein QM597_02455 [Aeromicrobium sp.]|uniref:hypothetical protein n=1 Tax=Aeromicrobium sp. TaxID=1871063 RepID=UPI0039E582BD
MTDEPRRPTAVTLACVGAGFVALFVLASTVRVLADWGSLELQETVQQALDDAGPAAENLTLDATLAAMRVVLYIVVVAAVAMAVFAAFALRGDRQSRWGLTILCALAGVSLTLVGSVVTLFPAVVLVSVVFVLWTPEARVWFDLTNGRTPSPVLVARARARQGLAPEPGLGSVAPPLGDRAAPISAVPPPFPPMSPWPIPGRSTLPGALVGGAVTMIVGSSITAGFSALVALMYLARAADPEGYAAVAGSEPLLPEVMYGLSDAPRTVAFTVAVLALVTVLALAAGVVGAALLFGRSRLLGPARMLASVGLVGSAAALPVAAPIFAACLATLVLLRQASVRAWAAR